MKKLAMGFEFSRKPTQSDIKMAKEKYKEVCFQQSKNKNVQKMVDKEKYILTLWA